MPSGSQRGALSEQVLLAAPRPIHTSVQREPASTVTLAQHGSISQFPHHSKKLQKNSSSSSSSFTSVSPFSSPSPPRLLLPLHFSSSPSSSHLNLPFPLLLPSPSALSPLIPPPHSPLGHPPFLLLSLLTPPSPRHPPSHSASPLHFPSSSPFFFFHLKSLPLLPIVLLLNPPLSTSYPSTSGTRQGRRPRGASPCRDSLSGNDGLRLAGLFSDPCCWSAREARVSTCYLWTAT